MEFSLSLSFFLSLSIWCLCGKRNATNLACGHELTCFQLDEWDRPDMFLISCSFGCSSNVIHKYLLNVLGIFPGVCYNWSPSNLKFPSPGLDELEATGWTRWLRRSLPPGCVGVPGGCLADLNSTVFYPIFMVVWRAYRRKLRLYVYLNKYIYIYIYIDSKSLEK